jgi:hypothetical protein
MAAVVKNGEVNPKKERRNNREGSREYATPTHLVAAVNVHVLVLVPSTTGQDGWMMKSDHMVRRAGGLLVNRGGSERSPAHVP